MQVGCDTLCLACDSEQDVKVNFVLTHGLCAEHLSESKENWKCKHCLVSVKVLKLLEKATCPLCDRIEFLTPLSCSHLACLSCVYADKLCLVCKLNPDASLRLVSENVKETQTPGKISVNCVECRSSYGLLQFSCGHFICTSCERSVKVCSVCPDKCEGCKSSYLLKELKCGHRLCYECLGNFRHCRLCTQIKTTAVRECLHCKLF